MFRRVGSARVWWLANAAAMVAVVSGCAATLPREAVPQSLSEAAEVRGLQDVRFWGDEKSPALDRSLSSRVNQIISSNRFAHLQPGAQVDVSYLALSGGGGDGAFGAGLLVGWTESGKRPSFAIVTGVSTGALMAPFAFLGPAYDRQLKEMYTTVSTKNVVTAQVFSGVLGGDSLGDSSPLAVRIGHYVDDAFLASIAAEYDKGRRLYVATTNLDAQRPVIWDMGAIAKAGTPEALNLFRSVLLASASIPGAFPPVRISVQAGTANYEEMHVDGGTTAQVFFLPMAAVLENYSRSKIKIRAKRHLYVIRNTKVAPEWEPVKDKTLEIVGRSLSTVIKNQGIGDLYRIYVESKRQKLDFNYGAIPSDFVMASKEPFDLVYMNALFKIGYELGQNGYQWEKAPPGLDAKTTEPPMKTAEPPMVQDQAMQESQR
jgi:predicted patatin/cPLA2 family phospholipase